MNNVERLREQVAIAFEEASVRLTQSIRAIMADHARKGLLRSGGSIRRVIQSAEEEAKAAVDRSRELVAGSRSPILRKRLTEFVDEGIGRIRDQVNEGLAAVGLGDRAGQVLLNEALDRAQRPPPEPVTSRVDRVRKAVASVTRYIAHYIVLALIIAVVGGIVTAIALKAMNLD